MVMEVMVAALVALTTGDIVVVAMTEVGMAMGVTT